VFLLNSIVAFPQNVPLSKDNAEVLEEIPKILGQILTQFDPNGFNFQRIFEVLLSSFTSTFSNKIKISFLPLIGALLEIAPDFSRHVFTRIHFQNITAFAAAVIASARIEAVMTPFPSRVPVATDCPPVDSEVLLTAETFATPIPLLPDAQRQYAAVDFAVPKPLDQTAECVQLLNGLLIFCGSNPSEPALVTNSKFLGQIMTLLDDSPTVASLIFFALMGDRYVHKGRIGGGLPPRVAPLLSPNCEAYI
jgi:hypothetical protein